MASDSGSVSSDHSFQLILANFRDVQLFVDDIATLLDKVDEKKFSPSEKCAGLQEMEKIRAYLLEYLKLLQAVNAKAE